MWSSTGDYAVRENSLIKLFKGQTNAQENTIKVDYSIEELFGGPLLYLIKIFNL